MSKSIFVIPFLSLFINGCQTSIDNDELFQYSSINTLLDGNYDGDLTFQELKSNGNFGIGTFNQLDGEMIALDGEYYQIQSDGLTTIVLDEMKTPFAAVTNFKMDQAFRLNEIEHKRFIEYLNDTIPSLNIFYAIKVEGEFESIKTRSVSKQAKPYKPLVEVVGDQAEFEMENIKGTLVGFRIPGYLDEVNVAGFHFHFISDDRKMGGHVLDFKAKELKIEIDKIHSIQLVLSENEAFYEMERRENLKNEIDIVEQ